LRIFYGISQGKGNRNNESVATTGKGLNESWAIRIIAEGIAKTVDASIEAVLEVNECIRGP
jgi:hypothetical protein